ncbi:MAG: FAD-dependent oxidoreductase, partial [Planctomycetota bacterium]
EAASQGPWGDNEFMRLIDYLANRTKKFGGTIETGKRITKEQAKELGADVVVFATGAKADRSVPGSDGDHVMDYFEVFRGEKPWGKRVVILGNTGVALSTALCIVDRKPDTEVHIVGAGKKFGLDVNPSYIWRYHKKLKEAKVVQHRFAKVKAVQPGVVEFEDADGTQSVECDTVVLATPVANQDDVVQKRKADDPDFYLIGDAMWVRRGNSALLDGYKLGMQL